MGGCPIQQVTKDLDSSSVRKKRFLSIKQKGRNKKSQSTSGTRGTQQPMQCYPPQPIDPKRKYVQFPPLDDVEEDDVMVEAGGRKQQMTNSIRDESECTTQFYRPYQTSNDDQCISTVRHSESRFEFKQERPSVVLKEKPEVKCAEEGKPPEFKEEPVDESIKKKREEEIVKQFQQKLTLKLQEERQKMKAQYDEEYQRMQLMIKIQAKKIEMLKTGKVADDSPPSQHHAGNQQNSASTHHFKEVMLQRTPHHLHGGDTGGPMSERVSHQARKKADLTIKIPDIETSPTFFKGISCENEDQMPDIIKQIRKSTPVQLQATDSPFKDVQSPFSNLSNSKQRILLQSKSTQHRQNSQKQFLFTEQKNLTSPLNLNNFQFLEEDVPLRRHRRTQTTPIVSLDSKFYKEIQQYLQQCLDNNETTIDMSGTLILDQGAKLVAAMAAHCDHLHCLKLKQCRITERGAIRIFEELMEHPTLQVIDLSYNPISEKCMDALVQLLEGNNRVHVNLTMNGFSEYCSLDPIAKFSTGKGARLHVSNDFDLPNN